VTVLLYANGEQVTYEPLDHPHGKAGDLFLRIEKVVLNPGDRIEWSGDLPEGKTRLWVQYDCNHPTHGWPIMTGHARLKESDRRKEP